MEKPTTGRKSFRFGDSRQARIFDGLLRLVGPGPAEFFRDACRLMAEENPYDSTSHLVGHLVREIESALRNLLRPIAEKGARTEQVPQENNSQKVLIKGILSALEIADDELLANKWLAMAGRLDRLAHRRGLVGPRQLNDEFMSVWEDFQAFLDHMMAKLEIRFLEFEKLMRGMLDHETPTEDDLKILKTSIPHTLVTHRYFFARLKSPLWLAPLKKAGFLKEIPAPIQDDRGIAFPMWSAGEYVERVATDVPSVAYQVIMEAPVTENMRAHDNLTSTAIALPDSLAADWGRKEARWIAQKDYLFFGLPIKSGKLIGYLANGGEVDSALELAESLLTVLPDPEAEKKVKEGAWFTLEPRARFDLWEYEQVLKKNIPDLVNAAGDRAFSLLCHLLDRAIQFSQRKDLKPPEDFSYIWRPAIEDHGQNLSPGLKQILVTAVRDATLQMATNKISSVPEMVSLLEERGQKRRIFSRIALYPLRTFPDAAPELVAQRLTTRELFGDHSFRHEYFLLARECFGRLNADQRSVILDWIGKGPDVESFKKWRKESIGGDTTDEQVRQYRARWQLERLKPIEEYLQGEWKERHSKLTDELGKPEHPEFSTYISGGAFGPISPATAENLGKMNVEDLVGYLKSWQPSGDPLHNASPEGLGRQISSMVTSKTDFYSRHAQAFELEEPTYVRSFIQGFYGALKEGDAFEWEPVLNLCIWASARPRDIPGRASDPFGGTDPDWGSTRVTIARFLSDGFKNDKNPLPYSLRKLVWAALEPITNDPDPDPKSELRYVGGGIEKEYAGTGMKVSSYDPVAYAMNTVRGEAMDCVIRYALWVRQCIEKEPNGEDLKARGFEEMPEVRAVLNKHLDVEADPSLAIRSVYGERFPSLYYLDKGWAAESVGRIFPADSSLRDYFDAAWEAYIVSNRPHNAILKVLEDEYTRGIDRMAEPVGERGRIGNPFDRLVEHLMTFYWWGTLNLDSPLIARFYQRANPEHRGHALEYIGRSFRNANEPIPPEVVTRVKVLWEARLNAARMEDSKESGRAELSKFGWWFVSRKFDEEWSVVALANTLRLAGRVDMPHMVIEYLADLASGMPGAAMDCLYMILSGDNDDWMVLGSDEKAKAIIRVALRSGKEDTQRQARDLVNLLGSRGYFDFGELLKEA